MNTEKLTQKSLDALQKANGLAVRFGNPAVDTDHLLVALVEQEDGVVPRLLHKLGRQPAHLGSLANSALSKKPRQSGSGSSPVYVTRELTKLLEAPEGRMEALGDSLVSVEHLLLAMFDHESAASKLPTTYPLPLISGGDL